MLELFGAVEGFKDETHQGASYSGQMNKKDGFEKLGDRCHSSIVKKKTGEVPCAAACRCEAGKRPPPSAVLCFEGVGWVFG